MQYSKTTFQFDLIVKFQIFCAFKFELGSNNSKQQGRIILFLIKFTPLTIMDFYEWTISIWSKAPVLKFVALNDKQQWWSIS